MSVVHLPPRLRLQMAQWMAAGYPNETCGLLLGHSDQDRTEIAEVRQARNLHPDRQHDRYELDPQAFLDADRDARRRGLDVVGVWHSHPDHPARPSETDRAAAWPGWSYLIARVTRAGVTELTAWRLNGAHEFEEETLQS